MLFVPSVNVNAKRPFLSFSYSEANSRSISDNLCLMLAIVSAPAATTVVAATTITTAKSTIITITALLLVTGRVLVA